MEESSKRQRKKLNPTEVRGIASDALAQEKDDDCAICLEILQSPQTLDCGHRFCRTCVTNYQARGPNNMCPLCRQPLPPSAATLCDQISVFYARLAAQNKFGRADEASATRELILSTAQEAVGLDPQHMTSHEELGFAMVSMGNDAAAAAQYSAAIASFKPARDSVEHLARVHYNLSAVLNRAGDSEGGEREARESLRLEETANGHSNLGIALKNRGDLDGAEEQYEAALRLDPDNRPAHANLGNIKRMRGDYAGTKVHMRRAVELGPNEAASHFNLAMHLLRTYESNEELHEAELEYRECIRCDPDVVDCGARVYNEHGVALLRMGNTVEACAAWRHALRIEPHGEGAERARKNLLDNE